METNNTLVRRQLHFLLMTKGTRSLVSCDKSVVMLIFRTLSLNSIKQNQQLENYILLAKARTLRLKHSNPFYQQFHLFLLYKEKTTCLPHAILRFTTYQTFFRKIAILPHFRILFKIAQFLRSEMNINTKIEFNYFISENPCIKKLVESKYCWTK